MSNFSCTIWQFLMFGCTCLCGGISLGAAIGRYYIRKRLEESEDTNPIKSYRGCDGGCKVDEQMYKNVVEAVNGLIVEVNADVKS